MKISAIPLLSVLTFWVTTISAQLPRMGDFVENSSVYPITGDVELIDDGGVLKVNFASNFATIQGITLEVFLTVTPVLDVNRDVKISTAPLDAGSAMSTPITGARQFDIPNGVKAYDYNYVIVQCTSAKVLWGHANLCAEDLSLTTSDLPSANYQAGKTISASSTLMEGATVTLQTKDSVRLREGFEVPNTTQLEAVVGEDKGCVLDPN